jgi:hypothetical protein
MIADRTGATQYDIVLSNEYLPSDNSTNIKKITSNRIVSCFFCKTQMEVEEATIFFNSKWFHDFCWENYSKHRF